MKPLYLHRSVNTTLLYQTNQRNGIVNLSASDDSVFIFAVAEFCWMMSGETNISKVGYTDWAFNTLPIECYRYYTSLFPDTKKTFDEFKETNHRDQEYLKYKSLGYFFFQERDVIGKKNTYLNGIKSKSSFLVQAYDTKWMNNAYLFKFDVTDDKLNLFVFNQKVVTPRRVELEYWFNTLLLHYTAQEMNLIPNELRVSYDYNTFRDVIMFQDYYLLFENKIEIDPLKIKLKWK